MKKTSGVATFLRIVAVLFMILGIGFVGLVVVPLMLRVGAQFGYDIFHYMDFYSVAMIVVAVLFIVVGILATGAGLLGLAKLISLRQAASTFEQHMQPMPPMPPRPIYPPPPPMNPYYNQPAPPPPVQPAPPPPPVQPMPWQPEMTTAPLPEPIVYPAPKEEQSWVCGDCGMSNIPAAKFCVGCGHAKP